MFTGIIQDVGMIVSLESRQGGARLAISTGLDLKTVRTGDSIAVDGVCLTVVTLAAKSFTVEASPETLSRTTLLQARQGRRVNLETALRMADPLGGHLVAGHVDGTGEILEISAEGNSRRFRFRAGEEIGQYLVEKGSVAVDGVSLTVASLGDRDFTVSVIPHTAESTTLGSKKPGDWVNLENDMIAKYVEKFVRQTPHGERKSSLDAAFLAKYGFGKSAE